MPKKNNRRPLILKNGSYQIQAMPSHLVKAMGWKEKHLLEFIPNPNEGSIVVKNISRKPIGILKFGLSYNELKYRQSPKKYDQFRQSTLSEEGRKILHSTNWDVVEDGGYRMISEGWNFVQNLKESLLTSASELKEPIQGLIKANEYYLLSYEEYLDKQGRVKKAGIRPKDYISIKELKKQEGGHKQTEKALNK